MLSETAAEIQFPATCARCGARVAERVSFCPHCGTHARLAFAKGARKPQSSQTAAAKENASERQTGVPPWTARPQPLFAAAGDGNPFAGIAAPTRDDGPDNGRQWGVKAGTAVTLVAFVALFGAIVLLHRHDDGASKEPQAALRTVEGSVQPGAPAHNARPGDSSNRRTARGNAPAVAAVQAPVPVAPVAPAIAPANPPPAVARAPENSAYASVAPKRATRHGAGAYPPHAAVPAQPVIDQPDAGNQPYAANETQAMQGANALRERRQTSKQASVEHSIALAQANLAKSNLSAARHALDTAQASQPGNSEAFMLRQDLVSREKTRDSALNSARVCAVQQAWNCAWHQAGRALSIDAGSVEAKALVQRAMIESGAASRPAGPGPDGPDGPPDVPLLVQ